MYGFSFGAKTTLVDPAAALPGRDTPLPGIPRRHAVLGTSMHAPWPEGTKVIYLASGCFWGAEQEMWQLPGVVTTAVGYMGGYTPNPTYDEVCSGRTGHAETILVAYDATLTSAAQLLRAFWENHDPTQGMRQGNDVGTQYRSAVYWTTPEQERAVRAGLAAYEPRLAGAGYGAITTELKAAGGADGDGSATADARSAGPFYYAEAAHQQYLHKNPYGYCPIHATGVTLPG